MAVALASLHLAPDRQPRQRPTTQFFTGRMPFLPPNQQRKSTEGTQTEIVSTLTNVGSSCVDSMCVAELLELRMHRARPRSTAGVWRDDDDGCGVERHLSRRVCDASAVHDHALLHDVCHRRHADATAYGDHQVRPQRHYTHPFNGPPFGTTRVSRYQKVKNQSGFY